MKMSRKSFVIAFSALMAVIIALAWWAISDARRKPGIICWPMTNRNISWQQTFHGGPWSE